MSQTAAQFPHYINGYVQDGKIYTQTYEGTQQVGVTYQTYADLQKQYAELDEIAEGYRARLIELKEIEIPLTQEELIQQQAQQLKESQALLARMAEKLDQMTDNKELEHEFRRTVPANSR